MALVLAGPAAAKKGPKPGAGKLPLIGIGDNGAAMFLDPNYRALNLKISRIIVPWDFYVSPFELSQFTAWSANAAAAGVEPLVSFEHSRTPGKLMKLPSVAEYTDTIRYLRIHFPNITTISAWNEANHKTQPTFNNPRRAAEYYKVVKQLCQGCKIVAADILDQPKMVKWAQDFERFAGKGKKLWGLHSYADTNKPVTWKNSATKKLLDGVKGKVWYTEVGGIVAFGGNFPYNEQRAAAGVDKTLKFASMSKRIERVYFYCWYGADQPKNVPPYKWDSGFVSSKAVTRASYKVLKARLGAG